MPGRGGAPRRRCAPHPDRRTVRACTRQASACRAGRPGDRRLQMLEALFGGETADLGAQRRPSSTPCRRRRAGRSSASDSSTIASSSGLIVRRSITSASMPSAASRPAACSAELDGVRDADDRDVAAAAPIDALADRHAVDALRHDAVLLHQPAVLEDADRVVVEDGREQQPLGVGGRARHHDLQARHAEQHARESPASAARPSPSRGRWPPTPPAARSSVPLSMK